MDILEMFFWYCKEKKIMDVIFKMFYSRNLGTYRFDGYDTFFENLSLKDFLIEMFGSYGFLDIFWRFQKVKDEFSEIDKYKKARSKWNAFVKNNLHFSEEYVKVGDKIEVEPGYQGMVGTVIEIPEIIDGSIKICLEGSNRNYNIPLLAYHKNKQLKINGEIKEPKFYIKRRRKIYGIDKG